MKLLAFLLVLSLPAAGQAVNDSSNIDATLFNMKRCVDNAIFERYEVDFHFDWLTEHHEAYNRQYHVEQWQYARQRLVITMDSLKYYYSLLKWQPWNGR